MGATTDPPVAASDQDRRILVAVDRTSNRDLLVDWFAGRPGYDVCTHEGGLPATFDLCLVDVGAYRRLADTLAERQAATEAYLPVVLLVSGQPDADQWSWIGNQLGDGVDDVTALPVRQQVLEARIQMLLRARNLSLDLSRRSQELAEARHRLELAVQASELTVWELDLETDEVRMAEPMGSHVGLGDAFALDAFFGQLDLEDRVHAEAVLADAVAEAGRFTLEVRFTAATTGERGWLHLDGEVQTDGDGEPTCVLGTSRDVTERVERERELAEARHRLALALEASGQAVWEFDPDEGRVSVHNRDSLSGLGDVYSGQAFRDLLHPEDRARLDESLAAALSTGAGGSYALELRYTHAETGEERWMEIAGEVVDDEDGGLCVLGTSRDVTGRKERERELERTHDLLTAAESIASVGSWEYYPTDDDLYWSAETRRIHGVDPDYQPTVEKAFEFFPPPDRERLFEAMMTAAEDGEPFDLELRFHPADGGELWVRVIGERTFVDGEPVVRGVGQDVTARVEHEQELERAYDRLARAQEIADVGAWELDVASGDLQWSEETYRIHDVPETFDPTLEAVRSCYHPDDRPVVSAAFEEAVSAGEPFDLELRLAPRPDRQRWVRAQCEVVREGGDVAVLRGTVQDITERKGREQELAASERRFRAVFEEAFDAMLLADDDGVYVDANEAACDLFGLPRDDLLGRRITDFAPTDFDFEANWASFRNGEQVRGEFPLVRPDGTRRTVEFVATPDVLPGRHLSVVRDVTERKERERELERHELVVQTASDPIYTVGPDGRFTMVNDAVREHVDASAAAVVGAPVAEVFGTNHAETLANCVTRLLAADEREGSVETTATFADGTTRRYQTRVAVMPFEEEYRGSACVSHDVTNLREHQRRLSVLDRVLRHNLRNKMNVILGHASTLVETSDAEVEQAASAILEAGEELLALGDAARRFQDTVDPQTDTTVDLDVVEHVRHVVEESRLDHPEATFALDLPESARARTPKALDLALAEVVENAVVHCDHEDPRIEVTVATEDETVVVRVVDNGPGVSSLTRRALDRGSEGPLEHADGLGLWLVRWTVAASGGTLDVTDNEPRGAAVELRFPLAPE